MRVGVDLIIIASFMKSVIRQFQSSVNIERLDTAYHWRVRWVYNPATTPFMPASRWYFLPYHGWNEADYRTLGCLVFLPVVVK
jgi:hypothetical protein